MELLSNSMVKYSETCFDNYEKLLGQNSVFVSVVYFEILDSANK